MELRLQKYIFSLISNISYPDQIHLENLIILVFVFSIAIPLQVLHNLIFHFINLIKKSLFIFIIYYSQFHHTNKPQAINIFPFENRFCCIFPTFRVGCIETRLSFCLPHISPPSMNPEFDLKLIDNLQPGVIESKPEAPWIRRNPEGAVFTENIQNVELDLKSETVQESSNQEEVENIILVQHEQMQDLSSIIPTYNKKDIEKLKQQLMLDKNVELKLAKLR